MTAATVETISELIEVEIAKLGPLLQSWARHHLIVPRQVILSADPEGGEQATLWLVTDHTGDNDSSCRVVFDARSNEFGLEQTLADGIEWYMGPYGSFADAVEAM
jgi:hypothetical protein